MVFQCHDAFFSTNDNWNVSYLDFTWHIDSIYDALVLFPFSHSVAECNGGQSACYYIVTTASVCYDTTEWIFGPGTAQQHQGRTVAV